MLEARNEVRGQFRAVALGSVTGQVRWIRLHCVVSVGLFQSLSFGPLLCSTAYCMLRVGRNVVRSRKRACVDEYSVPFEHCLTQRIAVCHTFWIEFLPLYGSRSARTAYQVLYATILEAI